MEYNHIIYLIFILVIIGLYFYLKKDLYLKARSLYAKQLDELQMKLNYLEQNRIDIKEVISIKEHDRIQQELEFKLALAKDHNEEMTALLTNEQEKNKLLVSQRQSSSVKVGQIMENLYPFLTDFPYDSKKCSGLFQPIDLLFWGEDEVVFIEIKSGNSQLSKKQKHIKDLIDSGKVRFEVHRINEKGVKIK